MSFFRNLFHKVEDTGRNLFHKVQREAPALFHKISQGSGVLGNILQTGSKIVGDIATNPAVIAGSSFFGPEAPLLLGGIGAGAKIAGKLGNLSQSVSQISNAGGYRGSPLDVTKNILEKARAVGQNGKDVVTFR